MGQIVLALTPDNDNCQANNCARGVMGTRTGKMPDVTSRANDFSSFMMVTDKLATSTATTTTTVTTTISVEFAKRNGDLHNRQVTVMPSAIAAYATACPNPSAYSSVCSCWGITAMTTTAPTSVSCSGPGEEKCGTTCAQTLTDPNNCGACGTVCASDTCINGGCTNPGCNGASCSDGIPSCGGGCYCFEAVGTNGFCGKNTPCGEDPNCATDADCTSGSVCAFNTCCGRSICLGVCSGTSKLKRGMRFDERQIGGTNSTFPAGGAPPGF